MRLEACWNTKIPNPEKVLASVNMVCIGGCKAVVEEWVYGKHGYSCGFDREPKECTGPYNWKRFWQEADKVD